MTESFTSNKSSDVTSEACAWIAQLETGDLSPEDLAAFREWIGRSPRHADEIMRLAHLSSDLNVLTEMADSLEQASESLRPIVKPGIGRSSIRSRLAAVTAVMAGVAAIAAAVVLINRDSSGPDYPFIVATDVGGYQETTLADGTIVRLNTDSQLEVDYDRDERSARLLRGEVYFDVAHEPDRPFVVYVRDKYVRAVGTAFVIHLREADFEVTISDGRVELADIPVERDVGSTVAQGGAVLASTKPLSLHAGQRFVVSSLGEAKPVVEISERDLQRELSWQEGLFDFSETPLNEVVNEVSRYTSLQIEFADPELGDLRFGGIFRIGETEPLFDALEMSFDIDVEYVDDDQVRLHSSRSE